MVWARLTSDRRSFLFAVASAIVLIALSLTVWNSIVIAPVKLFVVLLHELSHGLAAVATGGSIVRIDIDPRIGGSCMTSGGNAFLIASSGYIGSLLIGGSILSLARNRVGARLVAWAIALGSIVVALAFVRNTFGLVFCIVFGVALAAVSHLLRGVWLQMAILYLGGMCCLYALIDIREDLFSPQTVPTDAVVLSGMTGIPATVWSVLWGAMSLLLFAGIIRGMWKRITKAL
ncbi:MAG: M50 family metallopeptidase [Bacteroidota bacterium]|nr:M50 family metallopeptidase [Bacteroidota bacterium]